MRIYITYMRKNEYQGLILTNHVLERMSQRGITHQQIWEAYNAPDVQDYAKKQTLERKKKFGDHEVTIIYKHNELHQVVILSAWMEPPMPGSKDAKEKIWWEKYKNAGFWGKLWLTFLKQLG